MPGFQTEFEFSLPLGFVDEEGTLHREGVMRRATAADEILPLRDPRVEKNAAYLVVILLSRVVTRLGSLAQVTPKTIEGLFATDLAHLQDLYNRINAPELEQIQTTCPQCENTFTVEVDGLGGVRGYPLGSLYEEVAYLAYYAHWPPNDLLGLEHADRRRWVAEIAKINERLNEEATHA